MKDCPVVRSFICLISGALTLAVAAAESPTVAKYRTLKEELLTCPENAFEAKRAEMLKFLADPGETNPVRLVEFYLDVVERDQQGIFEKPDCWALAEKASKLSAAARSKYCQNRFWMLGQSMHGKWGGTLDPKWSYEGRLKFAEEVMSDPLVTDAYLKSQARNYKFEALRLLGRDQELLAYFDAELAKAKTDAERAEVLNARAAYYLESAKRYQDKSEPSVLKKALADLAMTTVTNAVYRDKRDYGRKLVLKADIELQLGQLAEASVTLDRYFDEFPDNGAMRADVEAKLGEVAYAAKDYATAVRYWAPYVKGWRQNVPATERYVRALFALDRKREALPFLRTLAVHGDKYSKSYYKYALEELEKELKSAPPKKVTEVIVSFDTEDYTNPRSADGIMALAKICREEGVPAHFEVVGLMAEALVRWGRKDAIAAIRRNLVGTHSWSHSMHPVMMERSDIEDYAAAYKSVYPEERKSIETVKRIFGFPRVWDSVPPGNNEPYVASRVYADLGVDIDLGPTYVGRDCEDIWYAGQRRTSYGYCFEFFREPDFVYDVDRILDELAEKHRFALFCHPNRVWAKKFWDGINYNGTNSCEFGKWNLSEEYTPEETATYLAQIRELLRRIKADPRFRIVTIPEILAYQKDRVPITKDDLPGIKAALEKDFGPISSPASWCVSDVFCAVAKLLAGEAKCLPKNGYGFLYAPKGVTSPVIVTADELKATAKAMDVSGFLPHELKVGDKTIGPADFLFAGLEVLTTGATSVTVSPREQLGSFKRLPLLERMCYNGTWVHSPNLRDTWVSNRMRWQLWTFRYE